jgi:hypothetical protein
MAPLSSPPMCRAVESVLGGCQPSPGASRRMMAWKCTTPRRRNSATFANDTRTTRPSLQSLIPSSRARQRRTLMVKRRQSSGADQLNKTAAV